ncbi:cytochrome P450 [Mycolicibacterium moriokaense]|nr:cytochrome P450 [Mycolicibacterium moriokaense]
MTATQSVKLTPATFPAPFSLIQAVAAGVDPVGFFKRRAGQSGPIVLNFPGLGQVLFFGTKEGAREVLTIPSTHSRAPTPNPIEPVVGPGSLILISGDQHRRERALLTPAFHGERVKNYADVIASATREEISSLRKGQCVAVQPISVAITLHVAIRVVFSVADRSRRQLYTEAVQALIRANTAPLMLVPALRRSLGGWGPWARLLRFRDRLDALLSEDMEVRKAGGLPASDMLDVLLSATDEDGARHSEQEMHDQLRTLLAAGHETTATTLAWALYHIFRDDSVARRLSDELGGCTTPVEMTGLPYLGAVIQETLRMHPPVPIVLRRLTAPRTIDNVSRDAGDIVGVALHALHFNPSLWPQPDRFDPERFIGRKPSPFEYAPFGGGYRRCIGASFAFNELAVAIGTILQNVELRMPLRERNRPPPRSVARGIAVAPQRKIMLEVVERC